LAEPLLALTGVYCRYPRPQGEGTVTVLEGVNLHLEPRTALGLIGESGAGKSTLARVAGGLEEPVAGEVQFEGRSLGGRKRHWRQELKQFIQYVWQDPYIYLNPYLNVGQLLSEPLEIFHGIDRQGRKERVSELLQQIGLSDSLLPRRPHQLSGGQCQRVAIARALAVRPRLLICDEILTGLDGPNQVRILDLLRTLREEMSLTILFISHDLPAVLYLCNRIAVLHRGRILEDRETKGFLKHPRQGYSRRLLAAWRSRHP
jgi:ABC-type dipeptide/oligopeptide/nickel transport system ATPase subunit